jgi:hypothetical protein
MINTRGAEDGVGSVLRFCHSTCQEGLRKTCHNSRVLNTVPQRSILCCLLPCEDLAVRMVPLNDDHVFEDGIL